jgi:hypothetical protein
MVMAGRHLPPDPSAGDESTLGGYMAVHSRPAAFDGPDGLPYSVDLLLDTTGETARPWGGALLFVRWRRVGEAGVDGHLESDFVVHGASEEEARDALQHLTLHEVKAILDALVQPTMPETGRRWWDAMRAEGTTE